MTDQTAVADLAKLVPQRSLEDWKLWMEFHFARSLSEYLPKAFADSYFEFFSKRLTGLEEKPARWQWAVGIVNSYLGEGVGELYVQKNFPPGYKADIDAIVSNIRKAFAAQAGSARLDGCRYPRPGAGQAARAEVADRPPRYVEELCRVQDRTGQAVRRRIRALNTSGRSSRTTCTARSTVNAGRHRRMW